MKKSSGISVLFCAYASAMLLHTACQSENAIAWANNETNEVAQSRTGEAVPEWKHSGKKDSGGKTDPADTAPTDPADAASDDRSGHDSGQAGDESLYPTAAQCG